MVRAVVKLLALDLALLVGAYLVVADLGARIGCATGQLLYGQTCLARLYPGYSYSLFTRYFSMVSGGTTLQSPPYLDWLQVLSAIFVLANLWYIVGALRRVKREKSATSTST